MRGVTVNLLATSDKPVTVTVEKDIDGLVSDVQVFVSSFNTVIDRIDDLTGFDAETERRGPLLGEATIFSVRNRLHDMAFRVFPDSPADLQRFSDLGVTVGSGGRLVFDEEEFREVLDERPELVEDFFVRDETGIAARVESTLDALTTELDGLLTRRDQALERREDLLSDRIDVLTDRLASRRELLTAQFLTMERALAALQSQQGALSALTSLANA